MVGTAQGRLPPSLVELRRTRCPPYRSSSTSVKFHQRIPRGGELQKCARAAAAVRVRGLGGALEGAVDFGSRQVAAEGQAKQLAVAVVGREQFRLAAALAEARRGQVVEDIQHDGEP